MSRTTQSDLDQAAGHINNILRTRKTERFFVGWAYGRPRLEQEGYDISPRLPSGQLLEWMHAYIAGIGARKSLAWRRKVRASDRERERRILAG